MKVQIYEDYDEMSLAAAKLVADVLKTKEKPLICLPGGDTPKGMYQYLVDKIKDEKVNLDNAYFIMLDEFVGASPDLSGSCNEFVRSQLLEKINWPINNCFLLDGTAKNLQAQCEEMLGFLDQHGPIDIIVLGIGVEGHVGFNESGCKSDARIVLDDLSDSTKAVMHKYFDKTVDFQRGTGLGIQSIMNAEKVVLIANGSNKADIVKKAIDGEISSEVPASLLRGHNDYIALFDKEAAKYLMEGDKY